MSTNQFYYDELRKCTRRGAFNILLVINQVRPACLEVIFGGVKHTCSILNKIMKKFPHIDYTLRKSGGTQAILTVFDNTIHSREFVESAKSNKEFGILYGYKEADPPRTNEYYTVTYRTLSRSVSFSLSERVNFPTDLQYFKNKCAEYDRVAQTIGKRVSLLIDLHNVETFTPGEYTVRRSRRTKKRKRQQEN